MLTTSGQDVTLWASLPFMDLTDVVKEMPGPLDKNLCMNIN